MTTDAEKSEHKLRYYLNRGVNVAQVSTNARGMHNVVQRQVLQGRWAMGLQKEGERLTNSTGSAQNSNLVIPRC